MSSLERLQIQRGRRDRRNRNDVLELVWGDMAEAATSGSVGPKVCQIFRCLLIHVCLCLEHP